MAAGDALLTTREVAGQLAMSEEWVRDHSGELGAIRAGGPRAPLRFEPAAIEDWKAAQRVAGPEVHVIRSRRRRPPAPPGVDLLALPPPTLLTVNRTDLGEER